MRSELSIKTAESLNIEQQIQEYFASGKVIKEIPPNVYKREEITLRDKRTILETSRSKLKEKSKLKSGDAMREIDRIAYKKMELSK
jgi:hypothetical protein